MSSEVLNPDPLMAAMASSFWRVPHADYTARCGVSSRVDNATNALDEGHAADEPSAGPKLNLSVPNPGGRLYPASVCLQMVLAAKGDVYQIFELENISGHPYGWFYVNQLITGEGTEMELSPGTELTKSLLIAARVLGYDTQHCATDDWLEFISFLRRSLIEGSPVIFGPIAYQRLTYQIGAHRATAMANHYVVLVGINQEEVIFHDPNGMSYIPMALNDLRDACTDEVRVPGTRRYSGVTIGERTTLPSPQQILGLVLQQAVAGYQERPIRDNGWLGLVCLKKYAAHITQWMGARTRQDRETVLRKLGLFFYPKSNQMRADAMTYLWQTREYHASVERLLVDDLCDVFAQECSLYQRGAALITPRLITFDEREMGEILGELSRDALALHELESRAFGTLTSLSTAFQREFSPPNEERR